MPRHLLSIDDLSDKEIDQLLTRAAEIERGTASPPPIADTVVGLLFGQTSLRTRVGFAAATALLGWQSIDILERRHDRTSMVESWADTLRTLSGYLDVLVGRPGEGLSRDLLASNLHIPYVNGGSVGADAEHPSQALIDLYAIESELGPIESLKIAICGDMRMRAVRSLLLLLARKSPAHLALITVPELQDSLPPQLEGISDWHPLTELGHVDVLYVAGIPHKAIPESARDTLRVTPQVMRSLPAHAVVLSPLPVVDEIAAEARLDSKVRMFQQSDRGLYIRMALLEQVTI